MKVGDKFTVSLEDESRLSDFESDLMASLEEGGITGSTYDAVWNAISKGEPFTVTTISDGCYECVVGKTKHSVPFCFEERDVKQVDEK